MEELFCKIELLRQEMNNVAREIKNTGGDSTFILAANLLDDIHRIRGRLMQVQPDNVSGHIWQNVNGDVVVKIKK